MWKLSFEVFKWAIAGFLLTAVVAMPFAPAWRGLIYDFQTLITGIFAIAAAYLTVQQMRDTDDLAANRHNQILKQGIEMDSRAQLRHEQLIELSVYKDRMKVHRTVNPLIDELMEILIEVTEWEPLNPSAILQHTAHFDERMRGIVSVLKDGQLRDADELFDGETAHSLNRATAAADSSLRKVVDIESVIANAKLQQADHGQTVELMAEHVSRLNDHLGTLSEYLSRFIAGLRRLEKRYRADPNSPPGPIGS